jgi:hypothetical protein
MVRSSLFALVIFLAALNLVAPAHAEKVDINAGEQITPETLFFKHDLGTQAFLNGIPNPVSRTPACSDFYSRLSHFGVLDVKVIFGYFDLHDPWQLVSGDPNQLYPLNTPLDSYAFNAFVRTLQQPCTGPAMVCGFYIESREPMILSKIITGFDGKQLIVRVTTANSSVSTSGQDNITIKSAEQAVKSAATEKLFLDSVSSADAVFYLGHARNGGGPDFQPPVTLPNGAVNYQGYYLKQHPGLIKLQQALQKSRGAAKVFGMFACLSEQHFLKTVSTLAPGSAFIGADVLFDYSYLLASSLGALDGLMRGQCGNEFNQALRPVDGLCPAKDPLHPSSTDFCPNKTGDPLKARVPESTDPTKKIIVLHGLPD